MKNIFKLISEFFLQIILILMFYSLSFSGLSSLTTSTKNIITIILSIISITIFITRLIIEIKNDKG